MSEPLPLSVARIPGLGRGRGRRARVPEVLTAPLLQSEVQAQVVTEKVEIKSTIVEDQFTLSFGSLKLREETVASKSPLHYEQKQDPLLCTNVSNLSIRDVEIKTEQKVSTPKKPAPLKESKFAAPSINFQLAPGDVLIKCPYSNHHILESRWTTHLTKCMKTYVKAREKNPKLPEIGICKYNWKHHMEIKLMEEHLKICPSKPEGEPTWEELFESNKVQSKLPVKTKDLGEEDWDEEAKHYEAPSFDYMEHIKKLDKPIMYIPGGFAPAERREFCAKQREAYAKHREEDERKHQETKREQEKLWEEVGGVDELCCHVKNKPRPLGKYLYLPEP